MNPTSIRFSSNRWLLIIAGCLVALIGSVARAQSSDAKPGEAAENPLANGQSQLAIRFKKLEGVLLRSAEVEALSNPARAALMQQAAALAKQVQLSDALARAARSLEQKQYSQAIEDQKTSLENLNKILDLLQSENRTDRVREQRDQIRRTIEETERLLRLQSSLRGRTEGGSQTEKAASDQQKLAEKAAQIAQDLNPDSKDSDGKENDQDKSGDSKSGDGKKDSNSKDSKEGKDKEGKDKESKDKDGKPSDDPSKKADDKDSASEPKSDKPSDSPKSDGKSADKSDGKNSDGKNADGKQGDSKDPKDKKGEQPGDQPKEGEQPKAGENDKEKSDDKQPSDSSPSSPKSSKPSGENSPKQSPSESQPSDDQPSGEQSGDQSQESSQPQQQQPKSPTDRATERMKQARKRMQEAQKKLEESERKGAVEKQRQAEQELKTAIEELEEILRQLREEEIERSLTALEERLRLMLQLQNKVLDETKRLQEIGAGGNDRQIEIRANTLAADEKKILGEAQRALLLLREEGTSAAFPESLSHIISDMQKVVERLTKADIGKLTIGIEEDIVSSLEELVAAMSEIKKENKERKENQMQVPGQQQGQPGEQPLVNQLAEMRLIKTLQLRINKRTQTLSEVLKDPADVVGQAEATDIQNQLRELAERQSSIKQVTRDIVTGKNKQ